MKQLFFLLSIVLMGCASQKVTYETNSLSAPKTVKIIPIDVDIKVLTDNRKLNDSNNILFKSLWPKVKKYSIYMCYNIEKDYKRGVVPIQITQMMVEHFNKMNLFRMAYFQQSQQSEYYITGALRSFFGEQDFSGKAFTGMQMGLIGTIATANVKTNVWIRIQITDLKLFKKDGELVKDFGDFSMFFHDVMDEDGTCMCIYKNINEKLKEYNSRLTEKLRYDLEEIFFEE